MKNFIIFCMLITSSVYANQPPMTVGFEDFFTTTTSPQGNPSGECFITGDGNDLTTLLEIASDKYIGISGGDQIIVEGTLTPISARLKHAGFPLAEVIDETGERLFDSVVVAGVGEIYSSANSQTTGLFAADSSDAKFVKIGNGIADLFTAPCFDAYSSIGSEVMKTITTNSGDNAASSTDCAGIDFEIILTLKDAHVNKHFPGVTVAQLTDAQVQTMFLNIMKYYNEKETTLIRYENDAFLNSQNFSTNGVASKIPKEGTCVIEEQLSSCTDCFVDGVDMSTINPLDCFSSKSQHCRKFFGKDGHTAKYNSSLMVGDAINGMTRVSQASVFARKYNKEVSPAERMTIRDEMRVNSSFTLTNSLRSFAQNTAASKQVGSRFKDIYNSVPSTQPSTGPSTSIPNQPSMPAPIINGGSGSLAEPVNPGVTSPGVTNPGSTGSINTGSTGSINTGSTGSITSGTAGSITSGTAGSITSGSAGSITSGTANAAVAGTSSCNNGEPCFIGAACVQPEGAGNPCASVGAQCIAGECTSTYAGSISSGSSYGGSSSGSCPSPGSPGCPCTYDGACTNSGPNPLCAPTVNGNVCFNTENVSSAVTVNAYDLCHTDDLSAFLDFSGALPANINTPSSTDADCSPGNTCKYLSADFANNEIFFGCCPSGGSVNSTPSSSYPSSSSSSPSSSSAPSGTSGVTMGGVAVSSPSSSGSGFTTSGPVETAGSSGSTSSINSGSGSTVTPPPGGSPSSTSTTTAPPPPPSIPTFTIPTYNPPSINFPSFP
ncbi:MAG: hypothetical protein CME61_07065 [Halobacteriovoraceae bacterium]|nr:hypothetical protein [Halobacteriovoraceae bacterium]